MPGRVPSSPGAGIRRVSGRWANPPLKGGSGTVRCLHSVLSAIEVFVGGGRACCVLVVPHLCVVLLVPVRLEAGSDSFDLSFEQL